MIKFKIEGVAAMQAKLRAIARNTPAALERALRQECEIEMTEAKRRTPVQYGVLRASGHVSSPQRNGQRIYVTLSFGGAAEAYAIYVHEDLDAHHTVGQAKFLESTLNESRAHMAARLAHRVDLNAVL